MRTSLLGVNLAKPSLIDAFILIVAISLPITSYLFIDQCPSKNLFERSGSLVVLLSGIVEYRNIQIQQMLNDKAAAISGGIGGVLIPTKQPFLRYVISLAAHIIIIIGTIIWGYGSLLIGQH